jgi:TP901 family phage tail tape measure protein
MSREIERIHLTVTARTDEFMKGMNGVANKMTDVGRQMTNIGGQMTRYVTLPIIGIGTAAVKMAMDFEYTMAKIEALVGVQREQLDAWSDDIKNIAIQYGILPNALADALYFITSAGLRGQEAMEVLEISAKGAASGLGNTTDIARLLTFVINAYGKENITAARAADILTAAIREGSLESDQLAGVMGTLLPTASALSISFETLAGSYAIMSRTGSEAAEITTMLNAVMTALIKPTPQVAKALSDVGLEMADLRAIASSGPDGLIEVFRTLADAFGDNDEALAQIFPNVRAFRAVMSMLAQDADEVDAIIRSVAGSVGILDEAWGIMSDTTQQKWNEMKATIAVGLGELGDVLLPMVAEKMGIVTDKVMELAEAFAALDEDEQKNIITKVAYLAATGPVLSVLGNLTIVTAGLIKLFSGPAGWIVLLGIAANAIAEYRDRTFEAWGISEKWRDVLRFTFAPIGNVKWAIDKLNEAIKTHGSLTEALIAPWKAVVEWINRAPRTRIFQGSFKG